MLTKKQQLYKNKKPKITKEEKDYLDWLQNRATTCWYCGTPYNIEWHHIKLKSTDKKDHKRLIPLCTEHHKGNKISPHGTPTKWREKFTIEEQNRYADRFYKSYLSGLE